MGKFRGPHRSSRRSRPTIFRRGSLEQLEARALLHGGDDMHAVDTADVGPTPITVLDLGDAQAAGLLAFAQASGLNSPTVGAPGTPVHSTVFDLENLSDVDVSPLTPWNLSFDRTTQTVWFVNRGSGAVNIRPTPPNPPTSGNQIVQFDPATNRLRIYALNAIIPSSDPHGIFFDFETHLTPRVWFVKRNADRISYVDLERNEIVSYDLRQLLGESADSIEAHAVTVDRRGTVWVTDVVGNRVLELEFDFTLDPDSRVGPTPSLNSRVGILTSHQLPPPRHPVNVDGRPASGPHGIDVVVDDRTNEAYVYVTRLSDGTVNLLRPGTGLNGADVWFDWNLDELIRAELSINTSNPATKVGDPQFISVDTNETPGFPEDDRLFFADSGPQPNLNLNNVIRELRPGNVLTDRNFATSPVRTWEVPTPQGLPASAVHGQPTQTLVDREGNALFADRVYGIGRLDTRNEVFSKQDTGTIPLFEAPVNRVETTPRRIRLEPIPQGMQTGFRLDPRTVVLPPGRVIPPPPLNNSLLADRSIANGLDQYEIRNNPNANGGQGSGVFRVTLNAANVLYGSLPLPTGEDKVSASVYAETPRRQMSLVVGPDDARKAFQVLRDGSLVVTEKEENSVVDQQTNLTLKFAGPHFYGDSSAVLQGDQVSVFGRDLRGGLSVYQVVGFDPASLAWTSRQLGGTESVLASDPKAFLHPTRGAAAMVTTSGGHLLMVFADNGQAIDLTATHQTPADEEHVYSTVGVVVQGDQIFAYGTNQRGDLIEYTVQLDGGANARKVPLTGGRETQVFQDVAAIGVGTVRHVFATDGSSRLVHVALSADGSILVEENLTELTKNLAAGYASYQQDFAGRVYSGVTPAIAPNGDLFVYGTTGRELIEFRRPVGGSWQATNLTEGLPANRVFGAPTAYILPDGARHALQINEDGEVIEYYQLAGGLPFVTQNITLLRGNSASPPVFPPENRPVTDPNAGDPFLPTDPDPRAGDQPTHTGAGAATLNLVESGLGAIGVGFGHIDSARDRDAFQFTSPRTGRLIIDFKAPYADLSLTVYGARRRVIARGGSSDFGSGEIALDVIEGQTYQLLIQGVRRSRGSYQLGIRSPESPRLGEVTSPYAQLLTRTDRSALPNPSTTRRALLSPRRRGAHR